MTAPPPLPLTVQTAYAELIDQLRVARLSSFPAGSSFRKRTVSGRPYWYIQPPTLAGERPPERYLGPDSKALAEAISAAKTAKSDEDSRRVLVRSLVASGLPATERLTGDVVAALAAAGAFRLRAVLVGTVAYQAYGGLLGVRLPIAQLRTGDVDLAQDYGVSVALDDALDLDFLSVLRGVSASFTAVPDLSGGALASAYTGAGGFRVDVLTTERGAAKGRPSRLPSLRTAATPLRFLDFLLREPVEAALLHRGGVLVRVPAPERYAVHKLIVAAERGPESRSKSEKDLAQAAALIEALHLQRHADDLVSAWSEASKRGPGWRERLQSSRKKLPETVQTLLPSG
jgi:hypothetical protein